MGISFLYKALFRPRPLLIHVSNVPHELLLAVVIYSYIRSVQIVVDIRDLWPEVIAEMVPDKLSFLKGPTSGFLHKTSIGLQLGYRRASSVSSLTNELLDYSVSSVGRCDIEKRILPMTCRLRCSRKADASGELRRKLGLRENSLILVYAGAIGFQADFDTLVEATQLVSSMGADVMTLIIGGGPRVQELSESCAGSDDVRMLGWLESKVLDKYLSIADIGLIPYYATTNYMLTYSTKFAEYLSYSLLLLADFRA